MCFNSLALNAADSLGEDPHRDFKELMEKQAELKKWLQFKADCLPSLKLSVTLFLKHFWYLLKKWMLLSCWLSQTEQRSGFLSLTQSVWRLRQKRVRPGDPCVCFRCTGPHAQLVFPVCLAHACHFMWVCYNQPVFMFLYYFSEPDTVYCPAEEHWSAHKMIFGRTLFTTVNSQYVQIYVFGYFTRFETVIQDG